MSAGDFTVAPLVGDAEKKASFRELFFGQRRAARYYRARDAAGGLTLLWMEAPRFGTLRAYPCVLQERGKTPMVFSSAASALAAEYNAAMLRRWEELCLPERLAAMPVETMTEKEFREEYRRFRRGGTTTEE